LKRTDTCDWDKCSQTFVRPKKYALPMYMYICNVRTSTCTYVHTYVCMSITWIVSSNLDTSESQLSKSCMFYLQVGWVNSSVYFHGNEFFYPSLQREINKWMDPWVQNKHRRGCCSGRLDLAHRNLSTRRRMLKKGQILCCTYVRRGFVEPCRMFLCSKLPCLGWRSADFFQGFIFTKNVYSFY
jgi:hypothetical protein